VTQERTLTALCHEACAIPRDHSSQFTSMRVSTNPTEQISSRSEIQFNKIPLVLDGDGPCLPDGIYLLAIIIVQGCYHCDPLYIVNVAIINKFNKHECSNFLLYTR